MMMFSLSQAQWVAVWFTVGLIELLRRLFSVPTALRDLPRVPIFSLLWSYLSGEEENLRIQRLIMPFANEKHEGVVVVWALGRWMVRVLDPKLARQVLEDPERFPKEPPPDDLLLWKFIGKSNVMLQNGEPWRKYSRVVKDALSLSLPVSQFALLSRRVFNKIGLGGTIHWDVIAQQFALDAVGSTAFGFDFDALTRESAFVREYNGVMHDIANPLYLIMPFIERWFPRKAVVNRMESLVNKFQGILQDKKLDPGEDMITFMLKQPDMSETELRDNMVVLFIAGHDTSAGALSTLVYFLARFPETQAKARRDVIEVLQDDEEPTVHHLRRMPYLSACVKEALRINTPISYIVPRISSMPERLGSYDIPAQTSVVIDMYAIHHNEAIWSNPSVFSPERFLQPSKAKDEAWLPFSAGPRQCPARNFAVYELRTVAAMLLREYEWSVPCGSIHEEGIKNAFSPFALSLPYDLHINFTRRPSASA